MKKYSILMLAALALVACNKEQNAVVEQPAEADQIPVSFGAYVNRPITKAGLPTSDLTLGNAQTDSTLAYTDDNGTSVKNVVGFGVFGYYTNADNYDQTFTPNFMYNQHVYARVSNIGQQVLQHYWVYSPIKYWPNEFGNNAESDDVDKVSFFAYAPYVTVNPASGKVKSPTLEPAAEGDNGQITYGILGMKRNNATGDPMVQYLVTPYVDRQVDLLWGTASNSMATEWKLKNTNANQQGIEAGKPMLNIQHPWKTSNTWADAQKLEFDFKHALAKLNVTIDTFTNIWESDHGNGTDPDGSTKVFIRSVTFEGFETKAALNLNNNVTGTALWYNFDCGYELNNGAEFTILDGRKDGKEGLTEATKEYAGINPDLIQDGLFDDGIGVKGTPANLFRKLGSTGVPDNVGDPILVIPNGDPLKITIEYDVLTKDSNLAGTLNDGVTPGSVVKNIITRYVTVTPDSHDNPTHGSTTGGSFILKNGKKYTVNLHLGLNSVEFDANVSDWGENTNGTADLPHNNPNS